MAKKNANARRAGALERLKAQLKSGVKPEKVDGKTTNNTVMLTTTDEHRINSLIDKLTQRINHSTV